MCQTHKLIKIYQDGGYYYMCPYCGACTKWHRNGEEEK